MSEFDPETNETVWEYKDDPSTFFYSHHISGAERLENGNTLICEGSYGRLFEVTSEGEIVWEFINPSLGRRSWESRRTGCFALFATRRILPR